MARHLPLLLLLLTFSIASVDAVVTNLNITGNFLCDLEWFKYHMVLWVDVAGWDPAISTMSPRYSHEPHSFVGTGKIDGSANADYYVYMLIVHNCNHPEKPYRKLRVDLGYYRLIEGTIHDSLTIGITNAGEYTTDIIGVKKRQGKEFESAEDVEWQ